MLPMMEPMLTIVPLCCFAMIGTATLQMRKTANVFVSKSRLTLSRDWSTRGPSKGKESCWILSRSIGDKITWSGHSCIIHNHVNPPFSFKDEVQCIVYTFVTGDIQRKLFNRLVWKICNSFRSSGGSIDFATLACKLFTSTTVTQVLG